MTLRKGASVQIVSDTSSYTQGCYQGCIGKIEAIQHLPIMGRPPMVLAFVRIDGWPTDPDMIGGWHYTPDELVLL